MGWDTWDWAEILGIELRYWGRRELKTGEGRDEVGFFVCVDGVLAMGQPLLRGHIVKIYPDRNKESAS